MAQKPRVKAPKQRGSQRRAEDEAKKRRLYMLGGGTLVAVLAVVGIVGLLGLGGGGEASASDVREDLRVAGCTMQVVEAAPNISNHSDFPDPGGRSPDWNTDPPTSGPHYGQTLQYGSYTEPIDIGRVLHNLEHGAVYILHGNDVPDATVAQLQEFYADHANGTILAPYERLGNQIALGAWVVPGLPEASNDRGSGVLGKCTKFDDAAFSAFFDAFQFKGPESPLFRPSDMQPGEF
jgi:Protein of unknown function (DUF3105)